MNPESVSTDVTLFAMGKPERPHRGETALCLRLT
jgi:hypothetical protein